MKAKAGAGPKPQLDAEQQGADLMVITVDVELLSPAEPLVQRGTGHNPDGVTVAVVVVVVHVLYCHA